MSDADLWGLWRMWLLVAAALVVVAAGLLVAILLTARRILAEALRALRAAEDILARTGSIWALETTNDVAERMLGTVREIERKGGALVSALEGETVKGR